MSVLNDIKMRLRDIIEGTDSLSGKCFDIAVMLVIIVSMVSFVLETLPNLSDSTKHLFRIVEKTTLFLFVGEYLLRLWVAEKPLKYASSFFGIVDLLATLPGVILTGVDARAIRSLRLLRLLRLLKLARYNRAVRRLYIALKLTWEELVLFVIVSLILLFVASAGIYQFERLQQPESFGTFFYALWWSIVTLTTVGYGDVYPIALGGRIFTSLLLFVGLGVVAMPSGLIASALTQAREMEAELKVGASTPRGGS